MKLLRTTEKESPRRNVLVNFSLRTLSDIIVQEQNHEIDLKDAQAYDNSNLIALASQKGMTYKITKIKRLSLSIVERT
jgi:hypothetical protein